MMISPTDRDVGRGVIYRDLGIAERGVITGLNIDRPGFVYVRYGVGHTSAATHISRLEWEHEAPA